MLFLCYSPRLQQHQVTRFEAFDWFKKRGLNLKIEQDGRVFPCSDSSYDVINCLKDFAKKAGVKVFTDSHVKQINKTNEGFNLSFKLVCNFPSESFSTY